MAACVVKAPFLGRAENQCAKLEQVNFSRISLTQDGCLRNGSLGNATFARHIAAVRKPRRKERKFVISAVAADAAPVAKTSDKLGLEVVETLEPNSRVKLHVTVPPNVVKDIYNGVLKEFSKQAKIPGFRPGVRVPDNVLVNYIGASQVKASTIEALLKRTLPEAMSSVAGRALQESEHISTKLESLVKDFSPSAPLSYEVTVDVAPEVAWVSDRAYAHLEVEVEALDEEGIEAAAAAELRSRHADLGSLQVIVEDVLKPGNIAIVDMSAVRLDAQGNLGERILSAEQKGFQVDTGESDTLLPGFVEALVGAERGKPCEFDIAFPDDWEPVSLRGSKARFTVEIKELFMRKLPELNDELAGKMLPGCTSVSQLKEQLLSKHRSTAEESKRSNTHRALIDELAKVCKIDVPHSLLEEQGRQMYSAKVLELQARGTIKMEQIEQLSTPQMVGNFLVTQKENIATSVKQALAVAEIYKLESLEFTAEELDAEVENAKADFIRFGQEFDEVRVREQAQELMEGSKVLQWLQENAKITYVPPKSRYAKTQ